MATANTTFQVTMKNYMLTQWAGQTMTIRARDESGTPETVGTTPTITYGSASSGVISKTGTLTISNIPANKQVNKIEVRVTDTVQLDFVVSPAIQFPNGGDLIITALDVEIGNPV